MKTEVEPAPRIELGTHGLQNRNSQFWAIRCFPLLNPVFTLKYALESLWKQRASTRIKIHSGRHKTAQAFRLFTVTHNRLGCVPAPFALPASSDAPGGNVARMRVALGPCVTILDGLGAEAYFSTMFSIETLLELCTLGLLVCGYCLVRISSDITEILKILRKQVYQ